MVDHQSMTDRNGARLVYSTDTGRLCPDCGRPAAECRCGRRDDAVPARIVAKLRIEKKGRGGKTVTVVDGLPRNDAFLTELSQQLKRACGTGGSVQDGAVELQGDQRDRARQLLRTRGFTVKG
jgi:translation initiation factor 1